MTLPVAGNVLATNGAYGVSGTGSTPTLTLPSAANVRTTQGTFGVGGSGTTPTLADCSSDGGTSCVAVASYTAAATSGLASKVVSGNTVAGVAGTTAAAPANCAADGSTSCIAVASYTAAATSGLGSKVLSGNTVAGVAGNVTLPTAANVRVANGTFGASGTSITPTLADCSADGSLGCVTATGYPSAKLANFSASNVQSGTTIAGVAGSATIASSCTSDGQQNCAVSGVFKAANVSGISTWDVRAGLSLGGITGALKTNCRNAVSTAFNYDEAVSSLPNTAVATGTAYDYWDTVDDVSGFAANKVTAWSSNTYCDSSTWIDVTTTDGGNTASTCATSPAACQYKDKITNLVTTKAVSTSSTWSAAVNACASSTYGGYAAGTWRLPTQKELMSMYEHGIVSLVSANFMTLADMQHYFWSSSSTSASSINGHFVYFASGYTDTQFKTSAGYVSCVR